MYTKPTKILNIVLYCFLGAGIILLFAGVLLPWTLPFLLALPVALCLEPAVRFLCEKGRFPRGVASGLCLAALLLVAGMFFRFLLTRLLGELGVFFRRLPDFITQLGELVLRMRQIFSRFVSGVPDGLYEYIEGAMDALGARLLELPGAVSEKALELLSSAAQVAPEMFLGTLSFLLGVFFISSSLPEIKAFFRAQLPRRFGAAAEAARGVKDILGKYIRAQLSLMGISFAALCVALGLLGVDYWLLLSAAISIIDALPVLGAGTVLIPWALGCFLAGESALGVGLIITYAAVTVLRNCLQAKLLGDKLGLHPLMTLVSIYVGFKAAGIWGMMLFPIGATVVKKLNDSNIIRLWRKPEEKGMLGY